ncbi:MAG: hypothetical protein HQM14_18475 [SAR324 cluster bacterium]|nr:hypothetical protein [SAR324 cluster bacterium]
MNLLTSKLFFSRVFAAVLIADFLSLVILNLFEMPTYNLVYVFLPSFFAALQILFKFRVRRTSFPLDPLALVCVGFTLVLLTIPRLIYLFDWIPGEFALVVSDDYGRLADLIPMTLAEKYPLPHPGNINYLLSYNYASFYPMALFKFLIPFLSLKDTIILGNLLYHILILMSLVEISHMLLSSAVSIRVFIFLCTLFGGLDWIMDTPLTLIGHSENWQAMFNGNTQITAFFVGMYWTITHFVAFYALVLSYLFLFYTRISLPVLKIVTVLLLWASAFYCSPFSVMAFPLFAWVHRRLLWKRFCQSWVLPYVVVAMMVPLYIFFNRLPSFGFVTSNFRFPFTEQFWLDKVLSTPIFFTLVPLIELAGVPFVLLLITKKLPRVDRQYFIAAVIFFAVTYIVAYTAENNFSMRGMFLPTLVFYFLFAKHGVPFLGRIKYFQWKENLYSKGIVTGLVMIMVIGTIGEIGGRMAEGLRNTSITYNFLNRELPPHLKTKDSKYSQHKFNAEKFTEPVNLNEMPYWEKEIVRLPRQGFIR